MRVNARSGASLDFAHSVSAVHLAQITRCEGCASRSFISGIRLWLPEMTFAHRHTAQQRDRFRDRRRA